MRSIRLGSRTGPILGLAEILGHNRTSRNGLTNFTTIQIPIGLSNIKSQLCRAKGPIRCCVLRSIIFRRGRLGWDFPCMFAHLLFFVKQGPKIRKHLPRLPANFGDLPRHFRFHQHSPVVLRHLIFHQISPVFSRDKDRIPIYGQHNCKRSTENWCLHIELLGPYHQFVIAS